MPADMCPADVSLAYAECLKIARSDHMRLASLPALCSFHLVRHTASHEQMQQAELMTSFTFAVGSSGTLNMLPFLPVDRKPACNKSQQLLRMYKCQQYKRNTGLGRNMNSVL